MGDWGGRPTVDLMIGAVGPYRFILDTGADISVLDVSIARELGLESTGETEIGSPLGGTVPARQMRLERVRLDTLPLGAFDVLEIELLKVLGAGDVPVGVLSSSVFKGRSATFDFAAKQLTISDQLLPEANGSDVFDFCAQTGKPSITVHVASKPNCVNLDTGSPGLLALPLSVVDSLALESAPTVVGQARLVGAKVDILGARLDGDVRIGSMVLPKPRLTFHDAPNGNLGQRFLVNVALTLDHANRRIRIAPQTQSGERVALGPGQVRRVVGPPPGQKRYGMRLLGGLEGELSIAGVEPGSFAEAGGLRAGDTIIKINGVAVDELGVQQRVTALRSSPLKLEVRRNGEVIPLELSLG
ncbi:hypothetical protein ABI59_09325 [Acidobacteria bacterium Mor1]|nr:hypothetical protein ABI59_09325 [Acidobacteria bacterium Mor1]